MSEFYTADGVNILEEDDFSALAGKVCQSTYGNSPYVKVQDFSQGHFRGPRTFTFQNLPKGYTLDAAPDGIGTKVVLIDAALTHPLAARDVVAMTCGDISRYGGLPLIFVNVLDVKTLGKQEDTANKMFRKMILGLGEVCKEQRLVAFKGETAELGVCVGSENPDAPTQFNWAGMAIGVHHPDKMIIGDRLRAGQLVMALRENGFRSNGISSVRKALAIKFGLQWYKNPAAAAAILAAAKPSVLYDRFLAEANGWFTDDFQPRIRIHLIVHVTGGAIRSKFAEDILFPRYLSAYLDNLWALPEIMGQCAEWRGMSDENIYETWNGGQGVLAVIDRKDKDLFVNSAIGFGIYARCCGEIVSRKNPSVTIMSKFSGKEITFSK